jgi:hypothetical protein
MLLATPKVVTFARRDVNCPRPGINPTRLWAVRHPDVSQTHIEFPDSTLVTRHVKCVLRLWWRLDQIASIIRSHYTEVGSGLLFHPFWWMLTLAKKSRNVLPIKNWKSAKLTSTDSHWKTVYHAQFLINAETHHITVRKQLSSPLSFQPSYFCENAHKTHRQNHFFEKCKHIYSLQPVHTQTILHPYFSL